MVAVLLLVLVGVGGADLYCRQEQQTHGNIPWYEGLGTMSAQKRCKWPLSFGSVTLYEVHETEMLYCWPEQRKCYRAVSEEKHAWPKTASSSDSLACPQVKGKVSA